MTDDQTFEPLPRSVLRFVEIDRALRATSLVSALAVAIVATAFHSYGLPLVIAGWGAIVLHLARPLVAHGPRQMYTWGIAYNLLAGFFVLVGALETGGMQSPALFFVIVVGLMAAIYFPHQTWWVAYSVGLVVVTVLIDLAYDVSDGDWLTPMCVLLLTLIVPRLSSDAVRLELDYRAKAVLDPLTGCLNRTSMDVRINELEAQAERTGDSIGVIAMDIDRFKEVNDDYGHAVGDEVLQGVAYAIRKHLRRFELLYRTGGEEFVLLLPGATTAAAESLAEKLRRTVMEAELLDRPVTMSLGVACSDKGHAPSIERLLERADAALYEAKRSGRNQSITAGVS